MTWLVVLQILLYGVSSALFLAFLVGSTARIGRWAQGILVAGIAVQFADIGLRCVRLEHPFSSTAEAIAFVGWLIALGFVAASSKYRLNAAGVFVAPTALVFVLLARVSPQHDAAADDLAALGGKLGVTHIFLSTAGIAIFALAAVLAVLYLVEERQLKRKQFGRVLDRGTPLDTLDRLASRCVSLGFPVFTVAIVTGAVWVARLGALTGVLPLRFEYILAVITWIAFGVLLVARFGAGWRGRRVAWLTLGGFGGAVLVLMGYFLRHAV